MSETVGKHFTFQEAKESADRMAAFWNEKHYVVRNKTTFDVLRGWPKPEKPDYITSFPSEQVSVGIDPHSHDPLNGFGGTKGS